jgi:hypothetical protein
MAHVTIRRLASGHPEKPWDIVSLGNELRVLLRTFIGAADPSRLSPAVAKAIPDAPL